MINIESNEAILLAPIENIRKAFGLALTKYVSELGGKGLGNKHIRQKNREAVAFFKEFTPSVCASVNERTLQSIVASCFGYDPNDPSTEGRRPIDVFYDLIDNSELTPSSWEPTIHSFGRISRLVLISLWSLDLIVLPKRFSPVRVPCSQLNEIAANLPSDFLLRVIAANVGSGLEFSGSLSESSRKNGCRHWLRLILCTNWTSSKNVQLEDVRALIEHSRGDKKAALSRYYVYDFLSYTFENDKKSTALFQECLDEYNEKREREILENPDEEKERKREINRRYLQNKRDIRDGKKAPKEAKASKFKSKEEQVALLKFYYLGNNDETLNSLVGPVITRFSLRRIFFADDLDLENHPFYSILDKDVKGLLHIVDRSFKGFISAKGVEKTDNYELGLSCLLCYLSVYLPRFHMDRDGDLKRFPKNFNEFTSAYYIARNEYIAELVNAQGEAPTTYFQFLELLAERFGWSLDTTLYAHIKNAQRYFEYIEHSNLVIPNAEKFKSNISDSDIPKTNRKSTTVKNVLPREYFQVFLSLLETLEYFIDHINGMADGLNPCIIEGKLAPVSYHDLTFKQSLRHLWGNRGQTTADIDLSLVNYTPIVRFEDKYYPLKEMVRFFTLTPYVVNGKSEMRATPHAPRILWLMANTGIRQQHLLWLDKDAFDAAIPAKPTGLAPLIVSTDKAHGEWVSIVSKEVIDVCERQKEWLERNEIESLKEPMWYSEIEKSRFGKFIPLFRLDAGCGTWNVHEEVGKIMWMLEKFIRYQLGDVDCPRLAYWKPRNAKKTEGKTSDHIIDIESFDRSSVDLSWDWRLYSDYTAHGLRAAFVSEHMRFLPPSLIGRHLTGQFSEQLVWYYTIMNAEDIGDHQQLLINLLMKNEDQIKGGGAPELAQKISSMNAVIARDIDSDPEGAISTHGLFSLSDVDDSKNGIAALKAKKNTQLAFNSTHICPFNNSCPAEVVQKFGLDKPCTVCPYAIRGVMHLPALNAQKFRYVELMEEYGAKIKEYKKRPKTGVIQSEIESLETEYDKLTRDAFALEAIEYQLYRMRDAGDQPYMAQDTQTIKDLYESLELGDSEHLIKRLIDVQCFPDLDSPKLQLKFSRLRYKLMMSTGDVSGLLEDREEPEHALLASQLHSMMSVKGLSIRDVFKIASTDVSSTMTPQPVAKRLGFEALKRNLTEDAGVE
jgi:hypothetical protein